MTSDVPPFQNAPAATVLTPAGPVPADKVHHVRPGQTVRRTADGRFEIVEDGSAVPTDKPKQAKEKEGDQPRTDPGGV